MFASTFRLSEKLLPLSLYTGNLLSYLNLEVPIAPAEFVPKDYTTNPLPLKQTLKPSQQLLTEDIIFSNCAVTVFPYSSDLLPKPEKIFVAELTAIPAT